MDGRGDDSADEAGQAGIRAESCRQARGDAEHSEARKGVHQVTYREIRVYDENIHLVTETDGTHTVSKLFGKSPYFGTNQIELSRGEAFRHPHDEEYDRIGQYLAVRRALLAEAEVLAKALALLGVTVD